MLSLIGSTLQMSAPSALTKTRAYEAYLRGPAAAVTHRFGTVDAYRYGGAYGKGMTVAPEPQDSYSGDFGIVQSGEVVVALAAPEAGLPADAYSITFDGVNDHGQIDGLTDLSGDAITIECWWRGPDFESVFRQQIAAYIVFGWKVGLPANELRFLISTDGGVLGLTTTTHRAVIEDGSPHHVAMVWQRNTVNGFRLLVDGVRVAEKNAANVALPNIATRSYLGRYDAGAENATGSLQEMRVWRGVARTDAEIAASMNLRMRGDEPGLVLCLHCTEGEGLTVKDSSNFGNHCALVNGAGWGPGLGVDARAEFFRIPTYLKNKEVDLELVTRIKREDESTVEIVNERRALVKSIRRRQNVLELQLSDVDHSGLEALIPSKKFTVADFPKLFADHVGREIPQAIGTVLKVPMTYLDNTAGAFRYSAGEVIGTAPTVLTVYRTRRIVPATDYVVDTTTVGGTTHLRVTFTKEQIDFRGAMEVLEADLNAPGSRAVSDEIRRVLLLLGATVEHQVFDLLAPYCIQNGMLVDCAYVVPKKGTAILADLLQVARGQLYKTPAGAFGLFVDRPRDCRLVLDDQTDELQVDGYSEPAITKTLKLEYRPSAHHQENFTGKLTRVTNGAAGETIYKNPYIRDHVVGDRWLCYMQRRENALAEAPAAIHGVQVSVGDLVAIHSEVSWNGWKTFAAPQVSRPADRNRVALLEYLESVYVYSPDALPADATHGYTPDYSFTMALAPTNLTVVSQGQSADSDGKVTAYALIRATPPVVNWARLVAQIEGLTTGEVYQAQLLLVGANYEAKIGGLRPNRDHQVRAWAVNGADLDGIVTDAVPFTSANANTALGAPTVAVTQKQSFEVQIDLGAVSNVAGQPGFYRNVLFEKVGAGSYAEVKRSHERTYTRQVAHGTAYEYKARSEDMNHNESVDSSTASITPVKKVDGDHIVDGSINQSRSSTSTGSASGNFPFGAGRLQINMSIYTFSPMIFTSNAQCEMVGGSSGLGNDTGTVTLRAYNTADTYDVRWRNFVA